MGGTLDPSSNLSASKGTQNASPGLAGLLASVLTPEAVQFLTKLQKEFGPRREALLERRKKVLQEIRGGLLPDFLTETASLRLDSWQVAPIPPDLQDRRVEITGPVDRKMVIN